MENTNNFAIGAVVSAKSRHIQNRQEVTVHFEKTRLDTPYWGEGLARNKVREILHRQGLNSYFTVLRWIH